jgi:type II/IV secretion system protein/WD40 domain-containing protein
VGNERNGPTLKLWSLATKEVAAVLEGHKDRILAVAFSPDGRKVGTASADGTVKLWDVSTRKVAGTLGGTEKKNGGPFHSLAFSPDGMILAAGTWRGSIKFWSLSPFRELPPLMDAQAYLVRSMAFSPDAKTLVTVGGDNSVRLWNTTTWRYMLELKGHRSAPYSVAFSPDGNTVATAGENGTATLWRAATLKEADHPKPQVAKQEEDVNQQAIVRIAHTVIQQALRDGASEIYVGGLPKQSGGFWVSFRIRGVIHWMFKFPGHIHAPLVARYKRMAEMNIEEHSLPQDGHIGITHEGRDYDIRVHSQPTPDGERITMVLRPRQ